jgi:hypothetical protein
MLMLKRSGHWWNSERIWFYATEGSDQISLRPHPVTVRLALLSPLLAIVATVISIGSLWTSRQAMQIGQRAYISMTNGSLKLDEVSIQSPNAKFEIRLVIKNLGNTPAHCAWFVVEFSTRKPNVVSNRVVIEGESELVFNILNFDVAPKEEFQKTFTMRLDLPETLQLRRLYLTGLPQVSAVLDYVDVFGGKHKERGLYT